MPVENRWTLAPRVPGGGAGWGIARRGVSGGQPLSGVPRNGAQAGIGQMSLHLAGHGKTVRVGDHRIVNRRQRTIAGEIHHRAAHGHDKRSWPQHPTAAAAFAACRWPGQNSGG